MDLLNSPSTLGDLFAAHRAQLKRTAHRILGDAHDADDLVHDAYLRAVDAAAAQPELRQPLSYAHRMVHNLAIDRYRRGAFEMRLFEPEDDDTHATAVAEHTPEALAIGREQLSLVARALAELPERVRHVFELYRLQGRTQREIGAELGLSAATVNHLIRQALEHCRDALRGR